MKEFDVIVVGAGVIGCSTTVAVKKEHPHLRVAVLEKEVAPATHTSGRNSGVIHAGFNPKPNTLKAAFCVEGNRELTDFCQSRGLPYAPVGTLVVALKSGDDAVLDELHRRGTANGVPGLRLIDGKELRRLEPRAHGERALHAPSGAIADCRAITNTLAADAKAAGCEFYFSSRVIGIEEDGGGLIVRTPTERFRCAQLINCGGVYADDIAHQMGVGKNYTIVPFRGDYYKVRAERQDVLKSMLYPAPDINYPFLGVHWTKKISGETWIGPNAAMAGGRETYGAFGLNIGDTLNMLRRKAFWKMVGKQEFRRLAWEQLNISLSRARFVEEARKLISDVTAADFTRAKSGIRPQLVNEHGDMIEDIVIEKQGRAIHVLNAVSPGFTCSLPFGRHVAKMLAG